MCSDKPIQKHFYNHTSVQEQLHFSVTTTAGRTSFRLISHTCEDGRHKPEHEGMGMLKHYYMQLNHEAVQFGNRNYLPEHFEVNNNNSSPHNKILR